METTLPHPTLALPFPAPAAKPAYANGLFDRGAAHYDRVVEWGFLRQGAYHRRRALQKHGLVRGDHLLDVACGTGLVAVEAAKILGTAANITCLDPSAGMLVIARSRLPAHFIQGRTESLPLADSSFDFLTMGYALRQVTSLPDSLQEYRRVLKPGGRLLMLEITKPRGRAGAFLFQLYFRRVYPFLMRLFTRSNDARGMRHHYRETMDTCVLPADVLGALRTAGFTAVKHDISLGLFSAYTALKP